NAVPAFGKVDYERYQNDFSREGFGQGFEYPGPGTNFNFDRNRVDLTTLRRGLQDFANGSNRLYGELERDMNRVAGLRAELSEMLKIRARAAVLARQIDGLNAVDTYASDIYGLDRDWRRLSYRLGNLIGLSRDATRMITDLDRTNETVTAQLQLGPSIDKRGLIAATGDLRAHLDNLVQEVRYEVGRSPSGQELDTLGRRVAANADYLSGLAVEETPLTRLQEDYNRFDREWSDYEQRLRRITSRYIERGVTRVHETTQELRELLLIPQELDRGELVYLTRGLEREVNEFFKGAQLMLLMKLPDSQAALTTAGRFYGMLENFVGQVDANRSKQELVTAFGAIEDGWGEFERVYRPIPNDRAQQVLDTIDGQVRNLRTAMFIRESFDDERAIELAAELQTLATHLDYDARRWLEKARPAERSTIERDIAAYVRGTTELYEGLIRGVSDRDAARRKCDDVYNVWRRVYDHVIKCYTEERPYLARTSSRTTPALVELRTMLD
ncbi:MAG: hypothetical protein AAGJ97_11630, partial [Planctomycetota bacterium]